MSWFSDLAGKAEDFLVKMDQNAAAAAAQVLVGKDKTAGTAIIPSQVDEVSNKPIMAEPTTTPASSLSLKNSASTTDLPKLSRPPRVDRDAQLMASLNQDSIDKDSSNESGSLDLLQENQLLKQEIKSLSQEIRQAVQCAKQAEKDNKGAQTQLKAQTASLQLAEQKLSTLQRENLTLADQMLDKHAELCTLKSKLEAVQVEKTHETHLYDLQKRLESELALRKSTESRLQLQNDDFEKKKATLQSELEQLHQQLESTKEELMMAHQSFNEYKLRAQRILQDKDKLLQDVKQQHQREEGLQPSEFLTAELDQLQQERDLLRVEMSQTNFQLQNLREEISTAKNKHDTEVRSLRDSLAAMDSRLVEEHNRRLQIEAESLQSNEELRFAREDATQQRMQAAARLRQHEEEVAVLRQQLANKQNSTSSQATVELERRLRSLTETLVAKQAALETVQSERSSLLLQLERASKLNSSTNRSPSHHCGEAATRVLLNITDDAKATTGVSRRVRSAYSTLDALNFRLGQALRRRPAARGVLFAYMVVLHFWVAFVLVTYSPETHPASSHGSPDNL